MDVKTCRKEMQEFKKTAKDYKKQVSRDHAGTYRVLLILMN